MTTRLYISTFKGVAICQRDGDDWRMISHSLEKNHATVIATSDGIVLAGTRDGLFRSTDGGESWNAANQGLNERHVRWLAFHPEQSDLAFVGTEPAAVFRSTDEGQSWSERPEVKALRVEHHWSLPYSPAAGCIRGFAIQGQRAYAAAEVGGVLISEDRGETWQLVEGSQGGLVYSPSRGRIHSDVHSIAVHPTDPNWVAAPTGGGIFRSLDGGANWEKIYPPCYVRAVWLDPEDRNHLILGPADGVDRNGRVEETRDGGQTWQPASEGMKVPWQRHMVERFAQVDGELLAVLSNGELWAAPLGELEWRRILPQLDHVTAAAVG
jgi:photosystem II stability/assembly factor-like uncharacterized protein